MLLFVLLFFAGWEIYLRSSGVKITYDDGKELWSHHRARVYAPIDKATVFIGSSRIKFDHAAECAGSANGLPAKKPYN
ncbi:MAG: hypothetical protein C4329_11155 [Chitinophagaceae bacterium]